MESVDLTSPHLLSENKLREILKEKCIEVKDIEDKDKLKLLEVFKRIALPLPQRKYNDKRFLGKKLCDLRVAKNINICENEQSSETLKNSIEGGSEMLSIKSDKNNILKSPINKLKSEQNNIRLSNNIHQVSNDQKRKSNESSNHSPTKRQKISWP